MKDKDLDARNNYINKLKEHIKAIEESKNEFSESEKLTKIILLENEIIALESV